MKHIDTKKNKVFTWLVTMFFIALVSMGLSQEVSAQRTVNVEPGFATLNEAIEGDTTATGERVDPNTVYVLERGGLYLLDGSIEHSGYHLTIVAEDGDGERPRLVPAVGDGGDSDRPFRPRGDLTIRGLYATNQDELGGINLRIVRISENEVTVVVDDCHLDIDAQSAFRIDGTNVKLFVTNSIISNIGFTSSPNNGRVIDDRGNDVDTLWLVNNTFYNVTSQVLRDGGGTINYTKISQNTAVNIGGAGGDIFEFGPTVKGAFTNNLVINGAFYGTEKSEIEEPGDSLTIVQLDSLNQQEIDSLGTQSFTISHNNIYLSSSVRDAYPDTVSAPANFNPTVKAYIEEQGSAGTFLNEGIDFTDAPGDPVNVITTFYGDPDGNQPDMDTAGEPFDFGYTNAAASFTGGDEGQQIGSLFWHGGIMISNEDEILADTPGEFQLKGNYPNPFNPSTNIAFDLNAPSEVSVDVYSIVGQKVMTIPAQRMSAGQNQSILLDASGLASGIYIYRVTARTASNVMVNTGRMTLIK